MKEIDDYFLNEKEIRENIAKGLTTTTIKERTHIVGALEPQIEKEQEISKVPKKGNTLLRMEKQSTISDDCSSFDLIFRINNDTRFSHLIRISPTMAIRLQRILLAKQLQGQRVALNNLIENILNAYLIEYEKEIKALEKPLFPK